VTMGVEPETERK